MKTPWVVLSGLALAFCVWVGFVLRSFNFSSEMYPDAVLSLFCENNVDGLRGLQACLPIESQPILPSLLRHFFWYPMFGTRSELAHQIPNLFYSHLTISVAFFLGLSVFKGRRPIESLVGATLSACIAVNCPIEVIAAGDWRNYAFVSLASLLYFWSLLIEPIKPGYVMLSGWALVNAHFFSIPLVGVLTLFVMIREWVGGRKAFAFRMIAWMPVSLVSFLLLSGSGFFGLFGGQAYVRKSSELGLADGLELFQGFWGLFGGDWGRGLQVAALAFVLAVGFPKKRFSRRFGVVASASAALLFEFVMLRSRSDYMWWRRYYAPFFGLGISAVVVLARETLEQFERLGKRPRIAALAGPPLLGSFALAHALVPGLIDEYRTAVSELRFPGSYHSTLQKDFHALRSRSRPILVVLMVHDFHTYPSFFLNVIEGVYTGGFMYAREPFRGDIAAFLNMYPNAQVVVTAGMFQMSTINIERNFHERISKSPYRHRVSLIRDFNAIAIDRVSGPDEVMEVARDFGIPFDPSVLREAKSEDGTGFYGYQPKRGAGGAPI